MKKVLNRTKMQQYTQQHRLEKIQIKSFIHFFLPQFQIFKFSYPPAKFFSTPPKNFLAPSKILILPTPLNIQLYCHVDVYIQIKNIVNVSSKQVHKFFSLLICIFQKIRFFQISSDFSKDSLSFPAFFKLSNSTSIRCLIAIFRIA